MANFSWRVASGAFDVAADWTNTTTGANPALTPPGPGDTANFSANGGTITGTGNVANLNFNAGPSWTLAGQVSAGNITVNDATTIANGGVLNLSSGFAVVANGNNATGTLVINAGGKLTSTIAPQSVNYVLDIGGFSTATGANGTVTASGPGALIDLNGNAAAIGLTGTGRLSLLNGAIAKFGTTDPATGTASLSVARAGQGRVDVDGAGSQLQLTGVMYAGRGPGSNGLVNVSNGASLVETAVGNQSGNNIGSGGTTNGAFTTGGTGQLNVTGGSAASFADSLGIGGNGGAGAVTVSGFSTMTLGGVTRVGYGTTASGGIGSLTVNGGSQVRNIAAPDAASTYLSVANAAGTTGAVTVDGAGSLLDVGANGIGLGNGGTGTLVVSGGATLRSSTADSRVSSALSSGNLAGSNGSVTVTGTGSSMLAHGYVYIGRAGTARLIVSNGASFAGGSAATGGTTPADAAFAIAIGDGTNNFDENGNPNSPLNFGGSGTAQVTGGSALHSFGALRVGWRGTTGSLLVDTGSIALADGQVLAGGGSDRPGGAGTITVQGASTLASLGAHALATAGVVIGNDLGTGGTINVVGPGSTLNAGGDRITVGGAGAGILTITGGARALSGASYADAEAALAVAGNAGSQGFLNVQGAGSQLIAAGQAVLGGNNPGTIRAGGTAVVNVTGGGLLQTGTMNVFGAASLSVDGASRVSIQGDLADAGAITTGGSLVVSGNAAGGGVLNLAGGVTDLGGLGALTVNMSGASTVLRVHGLTGGSTINGLQSGEVVDLAGITGATLNGNTVAAGGGTVSLGAAPTGLAYTLVSDGAGGSQVALGPAGIQITDTTTGASSTAAGDAYTGPVSFLQRQYIWSGPATDGVALRATVPNVFLKGGAGNDLLSASQGNNVLDGGSGTNLLLGGNGADGGRDTFFVDERDPSLVTSDTIAGFHPGDLVAIFGFHANLSTLTFDPTGSGPIAGPTLQSAINGAGTPIDASVTFQGLDLATVQGFSRGTGTLPGGIDYLLIQYT